MTTPTDADPPPGGASPPPPEPSDDVVRAEEASGGEMPPMPKHRARTFMQFVLRGLAISLPPILTLVILLWVARGIYDYIVAPASNSVRYVIAKTIDNSRPLENMTRVGTPQEAWWSVGETFLNGPGGNSYVRLADRAVPAADYAQIAETSRPADRPTTSTETYMRLADSRYFNSYWTLNLLVIGSIVVLLYFLGRFVTARIGHWFVHRVETQVLNRLPVIRNVYGSTKQVTDFLFSESEVEYRRVVAIEYPRRGVYSLGLVTGESMMEIAVQAGEPCVSVLIPSSPMPVTGYTISVPRSAITDLDLTVDQAFQFCISCGVLVPTQQKFTPQRLQEELSNRVATQLAVPAGRVSGSAASANHDESHV